MTKLHFSPDQLVQVAQLSEADLAVIEECRRPQNKLGFAYQLAFVRLFNYFPTQMPFEPVDDIVTYMSLQLDLPASLITQYQKRRETIAQHRRRIQEYLQLRPFHPVGVSLLAGYLYQEALQIEPTDSLLIKATTFSRDQHLLNPAEDTLRRMICEQLKKARAYIFATINAQLDAGLKARLDALVTHGYTEINFAAFAWIGILFSPRIKNIKHQWLYRIDENRDYGSLNPLVAGADHLIKMDYVVDHWERMAQFYASFKAGHVTASTAIKRLTGFTAKNHFYQANVQLGRILKTEHILYWMADPQKRKRTRKGLLKAEQVHQLARDITYGNRGRPGETHWKRSPVPAIARP